MYWGPYGDAPKKRPTSHASFAGIGRLEARARREYVVDMGSSITPLID